MWRHLPVWFRAIAVGLLISGVPSILWAVLAALNFRLSPAIPWSAPLMVVLLYGYWRWLTGGRWSRERVRAQPLSADIWRMALLAGGSAMAAVWAAFAALRGVLHVTPQVDGITALPVVTVTAAVVTGSIVAGVVEEAGFRGFMQLPLERAYGPIIAIAATSVIFTLSHLTHGRGVLVFLPFYLLIAVGYGCLAYLTGSILPGLVLHAAGDILSFTLQYLTVRFGAARSIQSGRIEPVPLVIAAVFAIVSVALFRLLSRMRTSGGPALSAQMVSVISQ